MTNLAHFLATPERDKAVSSTMKVVGSRCAQYIKKIPLHWHFLMERVPSRQPGVFGVLSAEELHLIRKAAHYCLPIGDDCFRQKIEQQYSIQFNTLIGQGEPPVLREWLFGERGFILPILSGVCHRETPLL
jgi:hypothetical protein